MIGDLTASKQAQQQLLRCRVSCQRKATRCGLKKVAAKRSPEIRQPEVIRRSEALQEAVTETAFLVLRYADCRPFRLFGL